MKPCDITKGQVRKLKTLYQIGVPIKDIAKSFGITESQVLIMCKGVKRRR